MDNSPAICYNLSMWGSQHGKSNRPDERAPDPVFPSGSEFLFCFAFRVPADSGLDAVSVGAALLDELEMLGLSVHRSSDDGRGEPCDCPACSHSDAFGAPFCLN